MASRLDLDLDLDLDVFIGPFDLLLSIVLREEISLLEVELGEIVAMYVGKLEEEGELELEVATEFLVLIAALLELKSRLMLPGADEDLTDMEPAEAVEELVARMLEYRRYRDAGRALKEHFESQRGSSTGRPRCRRSCVGSRSRPRRRSMNRSSWRPRSAICSNRRPGRTSRTCARPCLCAVAFRSSGRS